jgi:hypothetical protein
MDGAAIPALGVADQLGAVRVLAIPERLVAKSADFQIAVAAGVPRVTGWWEERDMISLELQSPSQDRRHGGDSRES